MDRGESSSDEEEDRQTLIDQNERLPARSPPKRSTFHIDDDNEDEFKLRNGGNNHSRNLNLHRFTFNKRFLFAIFLPLFIIIVYFTTDIKNLFQTGVLNTNFDSSQNLMRDSELQALYLLRQQQLGLFKLWKDTFATDSNPNPNSTALFEDLKSGVLSQISINKQIQKVLLSTHRSGNSLDSEDNVTDPTVGGYGGVDRCRNIDQNLSGRKTIEWNPKSNKYLFAICVSGQMSNHLICLEKHMFFAALLNRVLVIPSPKVDYEFSRVLDIDHINKCLGKKVVVTFEEFAEAKKNHLHIDKFMCYFSSPEPCFMDAERVKKLKSLGISMNKLEPAWVEDVKKPTKRTMQDVMDKFSSNDNVIAVGDVFFADLEQDLVMQPGGPLAHKCKTLIEPSRLIMLTAQRFIQTFLGKRFIALHFRRHGFLVFWVCVTVTKPLDIVKSLTWGICILLCIFPLFPIADGAFMQGTSIARIINAKKPSCFYPVPQAAECISQVVERANAPVVYLSTDAAESETSLLQSLVVLNGKSVPLVQRPARNKDEKWDALLYRHGLEGDPQVEAMLDKTICAMSTVFIGASGSTFTEDIRRIRKDWGSVSLCDEYLCQADMARKGCPGVYCQLTMPSNLGGIYKLHLEHMSSGKITTGGAVLQREIHSNPHQFQLWRHKTVSALFLNSNFISLTSSIDHSTIESQSSHIPSTFKELWKKISSSNVKSSGSNAELLIDFASDKMNKAWTGLEKAPPGSFKNKLYGLGLRLLARVNPSEILLKSISKEVTKVEVTFPSSLNARFVRRRLRHIAIRGNAIHKKYFYGSVSLLPLTSAFTGSERLLQLVSDSSEKQNSPVATPNRSKIEHDDSENGVHNLLGPSWVLRPSQELEKLIQRGDAQDGLSKCIISDVCKTFDLNTMDVLKYRDSL
ncbi:hypothetical protein TEA_013322 [Camellia sinensis var. sinensis]|uniref:GDP-fucose protein O-fucosyltransferase 2 n=1 Tax=Camellia sinensis var. sinensis TaxID=542762 RepID=A0A4S4DRB3_CAMSN|nr:hypothetical protein TEA_013322 [Camellia sinensis var. sinensis]